MCGHLFELFGIWRRSDQLNLQENNVRGMCQEADCLGIPRSHINLNVPSLHRLEVQADVQKEIFPKDTASLGAISDNASTRAMAGSIISSYNPQDRYVNSQMPRRSCIFWLSFGPRSSMPHVRALCTIQWDTWCIYPVNSLSTFLVWARMARGSLAKMISTSAPHSRMRLP